MASETDVCILNVNMLCLQVPYFLCPFGVLLKAIDEDSVFQFGRNQCMNFIEVLSVEVTAVEDANVHVALQQVDFCIVL